MNLLSPTQSCTTAADFVNFSNWRYYSNGSWVTDATTATAIVSDVSADFSVVLNPLKNDYVLVHGGTFLAPAIQFYRATSPTGPFTFGASFDLSTYTNEASDYQNYFYYAQSAHGNLSYGGDSGGLMISYVRSSNNAADTTNPTVYVPRFVNLPWSQIDP